MNQIQKKSKRQLILTIFSSLCGDFGSSIFSFGLSFMLLSKTGSVYSFALSTIISPIVGIILLPFVGSAVDKYSRKRIIQLSQTVTIVALVCYWLLLDSFQNHLVFYSAVLIVILRSSDQFTSTARQAANVQLVLENDLQSLSAYTQMTASFSGIISSILGAGLFSLLPFNLFIFIEILAELLTLMITALLDFNFFYKQQEMDTKEKGSFKMFKEGILYLKKQKYLVIVILLALICNFFSGIYSVGLPFLILKVFKLSNLSYGVVQGMNGMGYVVGGFLIQKVWRVKYPVYNVWSISWKIGLLLFSIGSLPIFITQSQPAGMVLNILLFLIGIAYVSINVPYVVWLQKHIPVFIQGRVFGVISILAQAVSPVGVFVFGILFGTSGISFGKLASAIFLVSGVVLVISTYSLVRLSRVKLKEAVIFPVDVSDIRVKDESTHVSLKG